ADTGTRVRPRPIALRSLVHPLEQVFELVEAALPEPDHAARPVDERRQRPGLGAVMRLPPLMPVAHQAGALQDAEMLGNGWLGDAGMGREHAHGLLPLAAQPLEDGAPRRVGKGFEEVGVYGGHRKHSSLVMALYITREIWMSSALFQIQIGTAIRGTSG